MFGKSKLITKGNWSISMPRAAISVAIRNFTFLVLNSSKALTLADCDLSPWIAIAEIFFLDKALTKLSAPCFVLTKIIALSNFSS